MKRVIVKLSGEALAGAKHLGIDGASIKRIAQELIALVQSGYQVGVVNGAGNIWRGRNTMGCEMDKADADGIGIVATMLNALALKNVLTSLGQKAQVLSSVFMPKVAPLFTKDEAIKLLEAGYIVIFAGGTGLPFFTTDSCAALRAGEVKADAILMAKNGVDGVYSADPNKDPNAKRFATLSYQDILSQNLQVMDMTAAALCQENNITTIVFDMNVEGNLIKVLSNPKIGTVIK